MGTSLKRHREVGVDYWRDSGSQNSFFFLIKLISFQRMLETDQTNGTYLAAVKYWQLKSLSYYVREGGNLGQGHRGGPSSSKLLLFSL